MKTKKNPGGSKIEAVVSKSTAFSKIELLFGSYFERDYILKLGKGVHFEKTVIFELSGKLQA